MITLVGYPNSDGAVVGTFDYGQLRDVTSPGAGDGSPWRKDIAQDIYYAIAAVCKEGGQAPSGSQETTSSSQFLTAIKQIGKSVTGNFEVSGTGIFGGLLTVSSGGASITGNIALNGNITSKITSTNTTDASSTDGAIRTAGGISVAKKGYFGTGLTVALGGASITGDIITFGGGGLFIGNTGTTTTDYTGGIDAAVGEYLYIDGGRGAVNGAGAKGIVFRPVNGQPLAYMTANGFAVGQTDVTAGSKMTVAGKLDITTGGLTVASGGANIAGLLKIIGSGTVTQTGSITNAVTLNTVCGKIATVTNTWVEGTTYSFTLNNTNLTTGSFLILKILSSGLSVKSRLASAGSIVIDINVLPGGSGSYPTEISFVIINTDIA